MKKLYLLLFVVSTLNLSAQTTVSYPQQAANYDTFFTDGGGNYDSGADQLGMWANFDAKQSVAWRNFTEDGTTTGTPSTMAIGDSFTITVSATQASFGVIGLTLLSSPSATAAWADRINNYAVQVNLNGNSGANDPWEVVSTGGTIDASAIGGSTSYADFKFKFTLDTATTMTVSINDGAFSTSVTLNSTNITGYSVYIADDWNGVANADILWKPLTEYTYFTTLGTEDFKSNLDLTVYSNFENNTFSINKEVNQLQIFDLTGKLIKEFKGDLDKGKSFDISSLSRSLYILKITNNSGQKYTTKLVKL
jgi:hypothetical protein